MKKQFFILFAAAAVLLLAVLLIVLLVSCPREPAPGTGVTSPPMPTEDPHIGQVEVLNGTGGTMWVPEASNLTPFGLEPTDFNVTDQIPAYSGEDQLAMRRGIDVSEHQGQIDWQQVAAYGIDFAIIRCGYSSYGVGALTEDTYFRQNIQGALAAGLDVGVYYFSQALNIVEAAEEAIYTLHLIEDYNVTLPVFFDWEPLPYDGSRSADVDGAVVTAACLEFCELVEAAGYEPGMYSYNRLAYFTYEMKQLEGITLWMGDAGTKPIFYYDHDFWQYSYTGSVPGIVTDVDLDAMYVRDGAEPVYRHPAAPPSPTPSSPTPEVVYEGAANG